MFALRNLVCISVSKARARDDDNGGGGDGDGTHSWREHLEGVRDLQKGRLSPMTEGVYVLFRVLQRNRTNSISISISSSFYI